MKEQLKPIYKVRNNAYRMNLWFPTRAMAIEDIHYYIGETLEWSKIENKSSNIVLMSTSPKDIHQTPFEMEVQYILANPRNKMLGEREVIE